jgi:hypothetical protein
METDELEGSKKRLDSLLAEATSLGDRAEDPNIAKDQAVELLREFFRTMDRVVEVTTQIRLLRDETGVEPGGSDGPELDT